MAKVRSPNYPSMSLGPAIEAVRVAFVKDNRNKMSRTVLAKHLGYNSLNGRSLGKIGAVRAYGLIDGTGDELRISDDAVCALVAPFDSKERQAALARMAHKPPLFAEIRKQFPDTVPSGENLRYWLVTQGFTQEAAEKAEKSYLATVNVASGIDDAYNPPDDEEESGDVGLAQAVRRNIPPPPAPPEKVKVMSGERELTTGLLSKDTNFRLLVSGPVGVKEIERLIKKLELDKDILAETDEASSLVRTAPSAPVNAKTPASGAQVSLIITHDQRDTLRGMGYSADAIKEMTPMHAHGILGLVGRN